MGRVCVPTLEGLGGKACMSHLSLDTPHTPLLASSHQGHLFSLDKIVHHVLGEPHHNLDGSSHPLPPYKHMHPLLGSTLLARECFGSIHTAWH